MTRSVKVLFQFFDIIFGGVASLAFLDIMTPAGNILLSEVSEWFKLTVSIVGLVYFIVMYPHRRKMRKKMEKKADLDNYIKAEELEKLKKENKDA